MEIVGFIIAGGAGRRMKGSRGPKPFLELAGRSLIARVIDRVSPQIDRLALSVGNDTGQEADRFTALGLPVVPDLREGRCGPLAGIEAALAWMREEAPSADWLAIVPCDVPFLPRDLVRRLVEAAERAEAPVAVAARGGDLHPLCAVIRPSVLSSLQRWLDGGGRAVHLWMEEMGACSVAFDDHGPDPFFNINTPEDLERAEALIEARARGTLEADT